MTERSLTAAFLSLGMLITALPLSAEEDDGDSRWEVEAELEIGVEAALNADDPDAEVANIYLSGELEAAFALSDRISFFTALGFESVTDPEQDRAFEDIGFYVQELGLSFDLDPITLHLGKISPAFGAAWDSAPGYFGPDIADDYETEEMIGVMAEVDLGDGVLSLSAFYPDDTRLSDSFGTRRGRNDLAEGGVGNTGKVNNFALQYDYEFDATTLHLGLRHLARGEEDRDENAVAIGVSHAIGEDIELIAEYARFNGWEGSEADASIATLGASLAQGDVTYNAALSQRRISDATTDYLVALGADYTFSNDMTLSLGLARIREEGEGTTEIGIALIIPFD